MRLRRVAPLLLIAAVFVGDWAGGWGFGGGSQPVAVKRSSAATRPTEAALTVSKWMPTAPPPPATPSAATVRLAGPVTLAEDETALVAEVGELQLLAQGTGLVLDSAQWSKLAAVTLGVQAIRQNYEAEIAHTTAVAPGQYRVEIPGYAAAGAALRQKFYAQLGESLGDVRAADVIEKLGARLEGHFGGFGVSLQTLDVARSGNAEVEITRTVSYWSRAENGDQLVTRHETHLPAWEDPSGERWGALLAVVARSGTAG